MKQWVRQTRSQFHNCDASTAELYMLITIAFYIRYAGKILADELAQYAIAFSMENPNLSSSHKDGIIDEVLHLVQGLVSSHAPYVELLMELVTVLVDGLTGLAAVIICLELLLFRL